MIAASAARATVIDDEDSDPRTIRSTADNASTGLFLRRGGRSCGRLFHVKRARPAARRPGVRFCARRKLFKSLTSFFCN
jgi:hypothetical protein